MNVKTKRVPFARIDTLNQGRGGETMLVDGFRAAQILQENHPAMYK